MCIRGPDTNIMYLCQLELEILSKLDFHSGHFKNCKRVPIGNNILQIRTHLHCTCVPICKKYLNWEAIALQMRSNL